MTHLQQAGRPLTLGENIPFADESPERPLIQARVKPIRQSINSNNNNNSNSEKSKPEQSIKDMNSSSDTDSSTTSNYRERIRMRIRLEDSVLRKVNRFVEKKFLL
jgi:hypothetical protein